MDEGRKDEMRNTNQRIIRGVVMGKKKKEGEIMELVMVW